MAFADASEAVERAQGVRQHGWDIPTLQELEAFGERAIWPKVLHQRIGVLRRRKLGGATRSLYQSMAMAGSNRRR